MSTVTAASLSNDIHTVNAGELLASVRYHTAPFGPTFLAELDDLLVASHPQANAFSTLNNGDVVEIQGESATGKTQILMHLAMVTALPVEASFKLWSPASPDLIEEAIEIGGKGCHLVLFDMDGRWDMYRLAGMLRGHLERRVKEHCEDNAAQLNQARASPKEIESHVQAALGRILFFRPSSLISLAASIKLLPKTLEQGLTRGTVSLILIDSLTATYWHDRWDLEQARQEAEATPPAADKQPKAPVPSHPIRQVLRELGKLRKLYGFVTVMTTTAFTQESRGCPFYKPILPPPYPAPFSAEAPYPRQLDRLNPLHTEVPLPITHHLTVHAMPIPPMDKEVTREKALGEEGEKRRFIVNHRQAYRGYLRLAVSGSAPEHHNSSRAGAFDFKVIPGGIDA